MNMEAQPVIKRSRWKELFALFLFFIIGGFGATVVYGLGGDIAGDFKLALFLLVFCRLAWSIYRRTFRLIDYLVYFAICIGFDIWVEHIE
jgi:hypothetical protein